MSLSYVRKSAPNLVSIAYKLASPSITRQSVIASSSACVRSMQSNRHMTTEQRPFQVLGLQQIAIGNTDKGPLSNLWTNIIGVPKIGNFKSEKENVDEDILRLGKDGSPHAVEIDLMMPIDEGKSPKVSSLTFLHIFYQVYIVHTQDL